MDAQYRSAEGEEASGFRLDDLFNAGQALQKHPKIDTTEFFVVGRCCAALSPLMAPDAVAG
jgi:hypothetical protein